MAAGDPREGRKNRRSESEPVNGEISDEEPEPDFSDPADYVDDISDDELLGDLIRQKPKETDGVDSVIVVDNIPKVGQDRVDKLKKIIRKIFEKFGDIRSEFFPSESSDEEITKGYIFIEYSSPMHAAEAVRTANGYKLDRQHTFSVNLLSDFKKYSDIPKEWTVPEPQEYEETGNLHYWLEDADSCDQYSVIKDGGLKTAIFQNGQFDSTLVEERERWTETYVRWSPQGTYLATFHGKGIALWGTQNFQQIKRFSHNGVQLIDYSPCERYLVTFSPLPDKPDDPQAIIIWDVLTGLRKRGFHCESEATWPIFKWSPDGKYFARIGLDALSIYEVPSFGLLDKKSLKITGVKDFTWSPSDNYIAYWVPEQQNVPARVSLIEIPSRNELCVKNLFNVADCRMHWQKNGDYLCVKVDRYSKSRRDDDTGQMKYSGSYYNFELFRIREKQIPVDKVECKEPVMAFAWEPTGGKFAYIHGESPRISVSFYNIIPKGGKVECLKTFERRAANHLFWSPNGQFVVIAGLRSMNGVLEFIDSADMTVMNQTEHFMATDVEWDPTGRYVATGVSWWGHKVDNAYWIWSFQGKILQKYSTERFCQLQWRPRAPTLLITQKIKEIKKNMKKYSVEFEKKDSLSRTKASREMVKMRRQKMDDYLKYREEREEEYDYGKERRIELRGGLDSEDMTNEVEEETIEFLLKVEETIISE